MTSTVLTLLIPFANKVKQFCTEQNCDSVYIEILLPMFYNMKLQDVRGFNVLFA